MYQKADSISASVTVRRIAADVPWIDRRLRTPRTSLSCEPSNGTSFLVPTAAASGGEVGTRKQLFPSASPEFRAQAASDLGEFSPWERVIGAPVSAFSNPAAPPLPKGCQTLRLRR